jgi:hypothetical protein
MADADRHLDSIHADGKVLRKQKLTEDAIAAVGELADIFGDEGRALHCVLHRGRQPTRCPVCALAAVRNSRGLRKLEHVYASGR